MPGAAALAERQALPPAVIRLPPDPLEGLAAPRLTGQRHERLLAPLGHLEAVPAEQPQVGGRNVVEGQAQFAAACSTSSASNCGLPVSSAKRPPPTCR